MVRKQQTPWAGMLRKATCMNKFVSARKAIEERIRALSEEYVRRPFNNELSTALTREANTVFFDELYKRNLLDLFRLEMLSIAPRGVEPFHVVVMGFGIIELREAKVVADWFLKYMRESDMTVGRAEPRAETAHRIAILKDRIPAAEKDIEQAKKLLDQDKLLLKKLDQEANIDKAWSKACKAGVDRMLHKAGQQQTPWFLNESTFHYRNEVSIRLRELDKLPTLAPEARAKTLLDCINFLVMAYDIETAQMEKK